MKRFSKLISTLLIYIVGISIPVLQLLFIILKLTSTVMWSWWWVLSPMILLMGVVILIYAVMGILFMMHYK